MLIGIMVGSIVNVRKLSTMSRGVPNNFLNKECKNKINYTRYIFLKENKDQFPNSEKGDSFGSKLKK